MVRVSVLMSEFNTPDSLLLASVRSILASEFTDFELIIVDDSHSQDLVRRLDSVWDPRIRVISNGRNLGLVASLNRGLLMAQADLVARMDTDDVQHTDRLGVQVQYLSEHPELSVLGSRAMLIGDGRRWGVVGRPGNVSVEDLVWNRAPIHPTCIMRRSDVLGVGGYPDYRRAEDLALWFALLLDGKRLASVSDVLLDYRMDSRDKGKRDIRQRSGEIRARWDYYRSAELPLGSYLSIGRAVLAGLMPQRVLLNRRRRRTVTSGLY